MCVSWELRMGHHSYSMHHIQPVMLCVHTVMQSKTTAFQYALYLWRKYMLEVFSEPLVIILWLYFDVTKWFCYFIHLPVCVFSIAVSHAKCDRDLIDKAYNTDLAYSHCQWKYRQDRTVKLVIHISAIASLLNIASSISSKMASFTTSCFPWESKHCSIRRKQKSHIATRTPGANLSTLLTTSQLQLNLPDCPLKLHSPPLSTRPPFLSRYLRISETFFKALRAALEDEIIWQIQ